MDIPLPDDLKRRPRGFQRKSGEVSEATLQNRRSRDRAKIEQLASDSATAAAGAAVKALMPPTLAPEVTELVEAQTQAAVRLVAANATGIVQAAVDKCLAGDVGALSLMLKYALPLQKTKIKLPVERGDTIESFADSIVAAASAGELSLEDSDAALRLLQRHSEVSLNSGLVQRLASLNAQLADARARNIITEDVTLNRKAIPLEDFVKGVRY